MELLPGRWVGDAHPCYIIAEIGQNHQGDLNIAKRMIQTAKECGVDCVKFQKSCLHERFTKSALDRAYASPHSWGATYREHRQHLEFTDEQFAALKSHADTVGIPFSSSATDKTSLKLLVALDVPFVKIGSGDTNNFQLLRLAAKTGKPLIVSTGMQDMNTVERVYALLKDCDAPFALLQCTSAYPTEPRDCNLRVLQAYKEMFPDVPIGYSGHETGIAISTAAVALGANIVERHFTLDRSWKGSDHGASLEPNDLAALVSAVRTVEAALGDGIKTLRPCELPCQRKLGKSIVARRPIAAGQTLTLRSVCIKVSEPPGAPPERIDSVIGTVALRDIPEDTPVLAHALRRAS